MVHNPPDSPEAVLECVRRALEDDNPLNLIGGGTKDRLGRRTIQGLPLSLTALDRLVSYEPDELVLVVHPGIRLDVVEQLLASENQHLAFEPPHWGGSATVGGSVAVNLSGPRRFTSGALRDHLLGLQMVDGHGSLIRAGGKVVKNVTGYDLPKVICGSFGTLGILTEICLRVWPRPETQGSLVIYGLDDSEAVRTMSELASRPAEITGLAHISGDSKSAQTFVRIEGTEPAVDVQLRSMCKVLSGPSEFLDEAVSTTRWRQLRELDRLDPQPAEVLWRFTQPASESVALIEALKPLGLHRHTLDWAGSLLWALLPNAANAGVLHQIALQHNGQAWRFATNAKDLNEEAFTPLDPGIGWLNSCLKNAFDPHGVFNPGRMAAVT